MRFSGAACSLWTGQPGAAVLGLFAPERSTGPGVHLPMQAAGQIGVGRDGVSILTAPFCLFDRCFGTDVSDKRNILQVVFMNQVC